ncbi:unnamed protein product [Camellia sinensis]
MCRESLGGKAGPTGCKTFRAGLVGVKCFGPSQVEPRDRLKNTAQGPELGSSPGLDKPNRGLTHLGRGQFRVGHELVAKFTPLVSRVVQGMAMAMQKLLHSDEYLSDADIRHILMEDTDFGGSNNGLIRNQMVADNKPTIQPLSYQQNHHPMPISGQLGLNQTVTHQKTICPSNRVSTSSRVTGIHLMQAPPMLFHGDFQVTEVVRDHVITTISTREHVSISNHPFAFPNQNQSISIFKNVNPAFVINQVHHQTPMGVLTHGGVAASPFHVPFPESNVQVILPNETSQLKPPTFYRCVKCGEVFITTQCYAAHVMAHYQSEKAAERLKKRKSKYKDSLQGVASVPGQSLKMTGIGHNQGVSFKGQRGRKPKMVVKTEAAVKKEPTDVPMAMMKEPTNVPMAVKKESTDVPMAVKKESTDVPMAVKHSVVIEEEPN